LPAPLPMRRPSFPPLVTEDPPRSIENSSHFSPLSLCRPPLQTLSLFVLLFGPSLMPNTMNGPFSSSALPFTFIFPFACPSKRYSRSLGFPCPHPERPPRSLPSLLKFPFPPGDRQLSWASSFLLPCLAHRCSPHLRPQSNADQVPDNCFSWAYHFSCFAGFPSVSLKKSTPLSFPAFEVWWCKPRCSRLALSPFLPIPFRVGSRKRSDALPFSGLPRLDVLPSLFSTW